MRLELAEHLIEKRGLTDEWKKLTAMRARVSPSTRPALSAHDDLPGVAGGALERLRDGPRPGGRAGRPGKRGPKTRSATPTLVAAIRAGPGEHAVPRRGLSEGPGAPGPPRPGRQRQARPAPDAPAPAPGAAAAGPPERGPRARRHDHHDAARRDVGHRRDAVLHRGGRLVLVLRRHRSLQRRPRRLARREARRSVGGPGADPPGRAPRLRPASARTSPAGSRSGATGARSTSPTPGSTR